MTKVEETLVLRYVALCGTLAAIVEWCVENGSETLDDNPKQLAFAMKALTEARVLLGPE
jgi:hypothetical protein